MRICRVSRSRSSLGPAFLVCAGLGLVGRASPEIRAAPPAPGDAPGKQPAAPDAPGLRFDTDVPPIFQAHWARCHGEKPPKAGLNLRACPRSPGEARAMTLPPCEWGPVPFPPLPRGGPGGWNAAAPARDTEPRRAPDHPPAPPLAKGGKEAGLLGFQRQEATIRARGCLPVHRLSGRQGAEHGSESGPVIVAGKPEESLLWNVLREAKRPPGKKDRLSVAEVETIRRWIEAGVSTAREQVAGRSSAPPVTG